MSLLHRSEDATSVDRFCLEIVDLAPALRLRRLSELRAMLEEVTGAALIEAMADARGEGWGVAQDRLERRDLA